MSHQRLLHWKSLYLGMTLWKTNHVSTLLGGDYLSVARAREAQYIRRSSELKENRLDGMIPVAEDWHTKVCFPEVSIQLLLIKITDLKCVGMLETVVQN